MAIEIRNVDCLEYLKTLPDNSVDLVLTDPPFGMSYQSNMRQTQHKKIMNDDNLNFLPELLTQIRRIIKKNGIILMFSSYHNVDVFKNEIEKNFILKNILIWDKGKNGMGDLFSDFGPQYEMILYVNESNKELFGKRDGNILKFGITNNEFHPTQKPVDMLSFLIQKCSKEGDTVFDPFAGSGSTAVTCKMLNRNFIGCELDADYCKIAEKRVFETQSGEKKWF